MPTFKVQGQVHHIHGSLLPLQNETHKYLQLYFVGDSRAQAQQRCEISGKDKTKLDLILKLQDMLHQCNPYVKDFKYVLEHQNQGQDYKVVIDANKRPSGGHRGRYNEPACSEVAVVIAGDAEASNRDIVLKTRDAQLKRTAHDSLEIIGDHLSTRLRPYCDIKCADHLLAIRRHLVPDHTETI